MNYKLEEQSGQVGLVTLLIMSVMLSVGISVVNRTTQDLRITRQEEEASQVLVAAEAGLERALANLGVSSGGFTLDVGDSSPDVDVEYQVQPLNNFSGMVTRDTVISVRRGGSNLSGNLRVDWGTSTGCSEAQIEITAYGLSGSEYRVRREGVRPRSCPADNEFSLGFAQASNGSDGFANSYLFGLQSTDRLIRVRTYHRDTNIRVSGSGVTLPTIAYRITSTATSQAGDETKVVEIIRSAESTPAIFDYVLYSGGELEKEGEL